MAETASQLLRVVQAHGFNAVKRPLIAASSCPAFTRSDSDVLTVRVVRPLTKY